MTGGEVWFPNGCDSQLLEDTTTRAVFMANPDRASTPSLEPALVAAKYNLFAHKGSEVLALGPIPALRLAHLNP